MALLTVPESRSTALLRPTETPLPEMAAIAPAALDRRVQLAAGLGAAAVIGGLWWWREQQRSAALNNTGEGAPSAPTERPKWRLYQLGSLGGLPTIDPACLKVQAFMRFLRPGERWFETDDSGATHISDERTLPVLQDLSTGEVVACAAPILARLAAAAGTAKGGKALDCGQGDGLVALTVSEAANVTAFTALVEHKLYLAMLYEWWGDEDTYTATTRPALSEALSFPLNFYLPYVVRQRQLARIERCRVDTPERAAAVGKECLAALAARLGEQEYFGPGAGPSSLDATVYGYLELIRRTPTNGGPGRPPSLAAILTKHPALVQFCERVTERYFAAHIPKAGEIPVVAAAVATETVEPEPEPMSEQEAQQTGEAWQWLGGSVAMLVGYTLCSYEWFNDDPFDDDE